MAASGTPTTSITATTCAASATSAVAAAAPPWHLAGPNANTPPVPLAASPKPRPAACAAPAVRWASRVIGGHLVFSHQRLWCAAPAREKKGLAIYHSRPLHGSPPCISAYADTQQAAHTNQILPVPPVWAQSLPSTHEYARVRDGYPRLHALTHALGCDLHDVGLSTSLQRKVPAMNASTILAQHGYTLTRPRSG